MTTSKGYGNYMSKKFFHPTNPNNLKNIFIAKEKAKFEKKKQDDMMKQYLSEQEQLEHRVTLGDEKAKMGLSFMYDAPPGLHKDNELSHSKNEKDVKFDWQRKFQAPREYYIKDKKDIVDNPFGIHVSNVKCIRCLKWGHVSTDSICPLYKENITLEPPNPLTSGSNIAYMSGNINGFKLKNKFYSHFNYIDKSTKKSKISYKSRTDDSKSRNNNNYENVESEDEEERFLNSLTEEQKTKLFNKIESMKQDKIKSKDKT